MSLEAHYKALGLHVILAPVRWLFSRSLSHVLCVCVCVFTQLSRRPSQEFDRTDNSYSGVSPDDDPNTPTFKVISR